MSDHAASGSKKPTLTYADAGVSIDAGNAFVDRIKSAVSSTTRPEVIGGLGGFGGLFAGIQKCPVNTPGIGPDNTMQTNSPCRHATPPFVRPAQPTSVTGSTACLWIWPIR